MFDYTMNRSFYKFFMCCHKTFPFFIIFHSLSYQFVFCSRKTIEFLMLLM